MRLFAALMLLSLLAACDSKPNNQPPPAQIFKDQVQAIDKAKGVANTLEQSDAAQREKIEDSSK